MAAAGPSTSRVHASLASVRGRLAAQDAAIVDTQIAIARIASPTGDEGDRARWVTQRFVAAGLDDVHIDAAGNAIGRRRGTTEAEPVVLCAHLDTVFARDTEHAVRHDGHRLIGPSITDNSRGLAVMLALADAFDGSRLPTAHPIEFVASVGEEGAGDLRGAKHYFADRGAHAAAAIIIDGAGDERIVHRALASRRFRVTFLGPGGHSWSAFGTANANHAAALAAARLARLSLPSTPRTTLSVGRMGGGLSVNSIADSAWLEIDLRSASRDVVEKLSVDIARVVRAATDDENQRRTFGTDALTATVSVIGERPGGDTDADSPLARAAVDATHLIGRMPDLAIASTDANVPISLGIPAIGIGGGGRGGDTHSATEWYENTNGPLGIARALTIVAATARLSPPSAVN
jgi:tripeptide aminopeptidase